MSDNVSSHPYITSYTFRNVCQHAIMLQNDTLHVYNLANGISPETVREGDKIYVVTEALDFFFNIIEPRIQNNFILITGRSDIPIDAYWESRMTDKVIKWFAVNNITDNSKIQTIPLGIDNKHWRFDNNPQGNVKILEDVNKEEIETNKGVLISFQPHTNEAERGQCLNYFKDKDFTTYREYTNEDRTSEEFLKDYYREVKRHKFNVCPFGTGYDCHRIWQTLILGSFPIVKKHKAMEEFYDLPIWFIDDWKEITDENIEHKYKKMMDKYTQGVYNMDKLWFKYWSEKIDDCITINN